MGCELQGGKGEGTLKECQKILDLILVAFPVSKDQLVNLQRVQGHPLPGVGFGVSLGLKVEPGAVVELTQAVPGARQPAEASPVVPWRRPQPSSRPLPPCGRRRLRATA